MKKTNKKILALVPIKEHSSRIPGKNLKDLAGKPMMAYILETLKKIKRLDRMVVSTESDKVAAIAKKYGADVPFKRPSSLTLPDVITHDVVKHAMAELEKQGYVPDYLLLVYTTSPLLKAERIEQAIDIALDRDSDTVLSGTYDKGHYWREEIGGWVRFYPITAKNSQFQEPLVKENGAICLVKVSSFLKRQLGADKADVLIMEKDENIDVDYPEDFAAVEAILLEKNKKNKKNG